jgi:hypothetical protein
MRTKPFKYTVEQMVEAIRKNRGFLYLTARSLGCHHSTVLDYRKRRTLGDAPCGRSPPHGRGPYA